MLLCFLHALSFEYSEAYSIQKKIVGRKLETNFELKEKKQFVLVIRNFSKRNNSLLSQLLLNF